MVDFWGHCQSKIAGLSYSTEDRGLGLPELTPLGKCSGVGRIHVEDVAGHQPIEEHAKRRQGLLDRGRRKFALEVLHESSDMERAARRRAGGCCMRRTTPRSAGWRSGTPCACGRC